MKQDDTLAFPWHRIEQNNTFSSFHNIQTTHLSKSRFAQTNHRASSSLQFRRVSEVSPSFRLGLGLAPESDSGVLGDSKTSLAAVNLFGVTVPNTTVFLQGTALATTSNQEGKFLFDNIPLALGSNIFSIKAQLATGKEQASTATIERVVADETDIVVDWNAITLRTIQTNRSAPPLAARNLAIVHTAIFDAVNALIGNYQSYRSVSNVPPVGASAEAAVAGAAYQTLITLYPNQKAQFDIALATSLTKIQDSSEAEAAGVEFGKMVGDVILAERKTDSSIPPSPYIPVVKPGQWRPTPSSYNPAALSYWKDLTPFTLTSASQFRPNGSPKLNSKRYTQDYDQVKKLGRKDSKIRTSEQTETAYFWMSGAGTSTPPGFWNEIAEQVSVKSEKSLLENARLFALLNLAVADAGIAAWDAKYTYNSWRPVTAIRLGGSDRNPLTKANPNWNPLIETPNHPDYVSGHSTFSKAAATVLTAFFGNELQFSTTSLDLPGVTRSFQNFHQAANEAGMSRIYGGIHTQSANRDGLKLGKLIGNYILQNFLQ
jgi:hypothetical protein